MSKQVSELEKTLRNAFFQARVKRDRIAQSILSLLLTEIDNEVINNKREPLPENRILKLLQMYIKRLNESLDLYKQRNATDHIAEEEAQLKVLQEFLPKQLSKSEILDIVKKLVNAGTNSFGDLMKAVREEYGASVDSKLLAEVVKDVLSS